MPDDSEDEKRKHIDRAIEVLKPITQSAAVAASAAGGAAAGAARGTKEIVVKGLDKLTAYKKSGASYVLAAAGISLFDYFTRGFGGLDVEAIIKNLPRVIYLISGSLGVLVVLAVLLYLFTKAGEGSKEEIFSFFVFIGVAYLCFVLSGFTPGSLVHIGFAIYTWFMLSGDLEDRSVANKAVALLLFLDFFGISLMGWIGFKYGVDVMSILGNRVVIPVWFLFSLMYTSRYEGEKPWWAKLLIAFVIAFYVFAFMGESIAYGTFAQTLSYSEVKQAKTVANKAFDNMKSFSINVAYSINRESGNWLERLIATGAGSFYGNPEETEPVGIFLEVEEPEAPVPPKASFYAEVSAKTLGILESVPVSARCWSGGEEEEEAPGEITPTKVDIFDEESVTFRCKFDALSPETEEITFEASASGLESTGELPVFFIDQDLKREMKKRGEDLFFGYYAGSAQPRLTYTNGPLGIGTTALNQPIAIGEEDVVVVLGIRLKHVWDEGEISRINGLDVMLPRGVELSDCDNEFTFRSGETHNIYSFDTSEFEPLEKIEEEAYFLCDMTIKVSEKNYLISGPVKAHPRFFYFNAIYNFTVKDSVDIEVIGAEEGGGGSRPPGPASPSPGTSEEEEIKQKIIDEAESQGVPWDYALAIAYTEHAGSLVHSSSTSYKGAVGLFQIMPFHVGRSGICEGMNRYDLDENIKCGIKILKSYYSLGCRSFSCTGKSYCEWDKAARYYVGWACKEVDEYCDQTCALRHDYYVELVNCYREQISKQTTIKPCNVNPDGEVYY